MAHVCRFGYLPLRQTWSRRVAIHFMCPFSDLNRYMILKITLKINNHSLLTFINWLMGIFNNSQILLFCHPGNDYCLLDFTQSHKICDLRLFHIQCTCIHLHIATIYSWWAIYKYIYMHIYYIHRVRKINFHIWKFIHIYKNKKVSINTKFHTFFTLKFNWI